MFNQYWVAAEKDGAPVIFRGWSSPPATDRGLYRILIWNVAGGETKLVTSATLQEAEKEVIKYVKAVSDRVVKASKGAYSVRLRIERWHGVPFLAGGPDTAFSFDNDLLAEIGAGTPTQARSALLRDLKPRLKGIQLEILNEWNKSADWSSLPTHARELASSAAVDDFEIELE